MKLPKGSLFAQYSALLFLAMISIGPFLWLLSTALKSDQENIFSYPPQWIPQFPTFKNFIEVWKVIPLWQYLWNSTFISIISVILNLLLSALAAYPLARMEFKGRQTLFYLILSTMIIPFQVLMIPIFILCIQLHLVNTYTGLLLPTCVSAFGIFLLRQAYLTIPKELEEAAIMDGCNHFDLWWRIMLPLIKPSLATLAIFVFVGTWSDFLWPLVILKEQSKYTLPLGIAYLAGTFSANWKLVAAGSVIATVPIVVFFLFLQKYFIGEIKGAVKG